MNLGDAIINIRKALKVSRRNLASNSGISVTSLYNIEKNLSFPSQKTINNISNALRVPISFLLFFSVTEEDVPEHKRQTFRFLSTTLKAFLLDELIQK